MKISATPRLALRALNESRRLDPLAYLSLRYTLNSVNSIKDSWAQQIAPEIVRRRPGPTFLENKQFKHLNNAGKPEFREVMRPGGPESLAEVALLDACAKAGGPFVPLEEVYSYHFTDLKSVDGAFVPYFELYSARQAAIGEACQKKPHHWVLFADIKSFYPSITITRATNAWNHACEQSSLDAEWKQFGTLLIKRQYSLKKGLLIGPLFSHLIANLVLREVDVMMRRSYPGRYFRYVDDFAIVVQPRKKTETIAKLRAALKPLGLRLHPKKTHWIGTQKWRANAPYQLDDYVGETIEDKGWKQFVDHLKCYLMANPLMQNKLRGNFLQAGMRVPLPRYTAETMEKGYGDRFERRLKLLKFARMLEGLNPEGLLAEGIVLRDYYAAEFKNVWGEFVSSTGLIRRWKLSKVRYLLGRMSLVGSIEQVEESYDLIKTEPEVAEYAAMLNVLLTRNADSLLSFGWKVAASIGQVLAAASISVTFKSIEWKQEHIEAYTTLRLVGVIVNAKLPNALHAVHRIQAVVGEHSAVAWAEMPVSFYRELSALIGGRSLENHQTLLQTPADPDERWEVFADELLGREPT